MFQNVSKDRTVKMFLSAVKSIQQKKYIGLPKKKNGVPKKTKNSIQLVHICNNTHGDFSIYYYLGFKRLSHQYRDFNEPILLIVFLLWCEHVEKTELHFSLHATAEFSKPVRLWLRKRRQAHYNSFCIIHDIIRAYLIVFQGTLSVKSTQHKESLLQK